MVGIDSCYIEIPNLTMDAVSGDSGAAGMKVSDQDYLYFWRHIEAPNMFVYHGGGDPKCRASDEPDVPFAPGAELLVADSIRHGHN